MSQLAIDAQGRGEALGRREEAYLVSVEIEEAEVRSDWGVEMDAIVGCGTEGVVARLEPVESHQCQPAVGRGETLRALGTPSEKVGLPIGGLRG
jgi:hypothetical protein